MIFKHRYVSLRQETMRSGSKPAARKLIAGKLVAHINYLRYRPGEDREKGQREFFDADSNQLQTDDVRDWVKQYCRRGDPVIHYLTLAPDVNPEDHVAFTREVMQKFGDELGLDLVWCANFHRNTEHHHANILLLGRDKWGRLVRLTKADYARAREIGDRFLDREHPFERATKLLQRQQAAAEFDYQVGSAIEGRLRKDQNQLMTLPWLKASVFRHLEETNLLIVPPGQTARDERLDPSSIRCGNTFYSDKTSLRKLIALDEKLRRGWFFGEVTADQYGRLIDWIETKENSKNKEHPDRNAPLSDDPEEFSYGGMTFSKDSSYADFYKLETWLRNWNREAKFLGFAEQPMSHADFQKFLAWSHPKRIEFFEKFNGGLVDHAQQLHNIRTMRQSGPLRAPMEGEMPGDPANAVVQLLYKTIKGVLSLIPTDFGLGRDQLNLAHQRVTDQYNNVLAALSQTDSKLTPEERYEAVYMLQRLDEGHHLLVNALQKREREEDYRERRRTFLAHSDLQELLAADLDPFNKELDNWE